MPDHTSNLHKRTITRSIRRARRRMLLETLEQRYLLAGDASSRSQQAIGDVDGNGAVTAQDALAIIYHLNVQQSSRESGETGALLNANELSTSSVAQQKLDVNGDGKVTAADALNVINFLNLQQFAAATTSGEAEATMFTVNSTADTGPGSLRQAILDANASTSDAMIQFAIPTSDTAFVDVDSSLLGGDAAADVFRIRPLGPLPAIQNVHGQSITIDGGSQSASSGNTNPLGPEIEIDGALAGVAVNGLVLDSDEIEVRGLNINQFTGRGILIRANSATIVGNYLGTDPTGTIRQMNESGVEVASGSNHTIGGMSPADRNILSGNLGNGLLVQPPVSDLTVINNFIGVNASGNLALPNGIVGGESQGIRLNGGGTNIIIGKPGAGNVISGNLSRGIGDVGASNVTIQSNFIGTDHTGSFAIPNAKDGIGFSLVSNLLIGGDQPNEGNVISGNGDLGIALQGDNIRILGNHIGTNADGTLTLANRLEGILVGESHDVTIGGAANGQGNLISGNGKSGIIIYPSNRVTVSGNKIGTNATGSTAIGNGEHGILVTPGSSDITIGGDSPAAGNLVSGNLTRSGIFSWDGLQHTIANNFVGTDITGLLPIPNNGTGIEVQEGILVNVHQNLVSGNQDNGIEIRDTAPLSAIEFHHSIGGNGQYFVLSPQLFWDDAEALAVLYGGHLADIANEVENEFLRETFGGEHWIGLNDEAVENSFVWSSGLPYDPAVFTKFDGIEPNGGTNENHVEMRPTGHWNDLPDRARRRAILEFPSATEALIFIADVAGVTVAENQIGLGSDGSTLLGNQNDGVVVQNSSRVTIQDNAVANNGDNGVAVTSGSTQVTVANNSFFNNALLGIDLGDNGVTANDVGDADTGPNGLQNFPVLTFSGGVYTGTLNSQANKTYKIEVFHDTASSPTAAQGKTRIHTETVTTDAAGNASFTIPTAVVPSAGQITATATSDDGSTSEFSGSLIIGARAEVSIDSVVINSGGNLSLGATVPGSIVDRMVVVTNRGTANLTLQPATTTGSFTVVTNFTAGQIVAPGASASITVRNTESTAGTYLGMLSIATSDPVNENANFLLGISLVDGLNLVKDINAGPASSTARQLTVVGDKLVLRAFQADTGSELWTSDLTSAGTVIVKDIQPGSNSSAPLGLVARGKDVFFTADDGVNGDELWKSDGTAANTIQLLDIDPTNSNGVDSELFVSSGGTLFFSAGNAGTGFELWRSDGTAAGTSLLKDINVGTESSFPYSFAEYNGKVYFAGETADAGAELWTTDGTADGTVLVKDIVPGTVDSFATPLGVADGKLFFSTFINDGELWTTDGTSTGTVKIADVEVNDFIGVINNQIFFSGYSAASGYELWKSDGTAAGTSQVVDIFPGADSGMDGAGATVTFNNKLYFYADNGITGTEVWETDGTVAGTKQLLNLNPLGSAVGITQPLQVLNGQLVIGGNDGRFGQELWTFDLRLPDTTSPTSHVSALPARLESKSITISVVGNDPVAPGPTQVVSGVKEYDLFVATGGGAYVKFATVPATNPTTTFEGQSNTTYFFRSIARDHAGNIESKSLIVEAQTYVPDLDPPSSSVTQVNSASPDFVVSFSGSDIGGSRISSFQILVSIDGAAPVEIATVQGGTPNALGVQGGSVSYRALADNVAHTYRFFTVATDKNGKVEPTPATGDVVVNATFAAPSSLNAVGLDVQRGQSQRSFIRNVDIPFNSQTGLQALLDTLNDADEINNRIRLTRFAVDGSGSGTAISLSGKATRSGSMLSLNFGASGIGGDRLSNAGNGYFRISIDEDGNGTFDRDLHFYRLFGDTNGDRAVNSLDVNDIARAISLRSTDPNFDIDGSGKLDLRDRTATQKETQLPAAIRTISSSLALDD